MSVFEELWDQYRGLVNQLSAQFGAQYRSYGADTADFQQEAVSWMLDHEHKLADKYEELADGEQFGKWLYRCLDNEFRDYAVDIKDQAGGQPRHGAYWYTPNELKVLLPSMLDPEKWHDPPQSEGGGRSSRSAAEGGNWIATLADVSRAFSRLSQKDQLLLRALHHEGVRNKDLAAAEDVTEATMSYRHTQALKRLLRELGGERPRKMRGDVPGDPWRGRHSVSNAQARAIQSGYYDE